MTTTTALRPATGEALWVMGGRMTLKAPCEDTNRAMSVLVMEVPAGTSVLLPAGVDENWGADPDARVLVVSTPAGLDAVFRAFGEPASGPGFPPPPAIPPSPEDMPHMGQVAAAHRLLLRG